MRRGVRGPGVVESATGQYVRIRRRRGSPVDRLTPLLGVEIHARQERPSGAVNPLTVDRISRAVTQRMVSDKISMTLGGHPGWSRDGVGLDMVPRLKASAEGHSVSPCRPGKGGVRGVPSP